MSLRKLKSRILLSRYGRIIRISSVPFLRVAEGHDYVFIVGCYNSGTSLLDYILGCHEEISTLPTEGVALTNQLPKPEDFGWPRMWWKCADRVSLNEKGAKPNVSRIKKEWGFWFDKKKGIFVEKSVANSARIRWINDNFGRPYFIWIIRNGYCVAEGIRRRSRHSKVAKFRYREHGYPIEWCAKQWVVNNKVIQEDTKDIDKVIRISYEELTENLRESVSLVLDWLPVKNKRVPDFKAFDFQGKERPIRNMNEESIANLSDDDIEKINKVAADYVRKWGYPVIDRERRLK